MPVQSFVITILIYLLDNCFGHGIHNMNDVEHMQHHLDGTGAAFLPENEIRFHYFHAHDIDGNSKLDGLEILQAFTHFHSTGEPSYSRFDEPVYSDDTFMTAIDPLLAENIDKNQDGYLDYPEFLDAEKSVQEQENNS